MGEKGGVEAHKEPLTGLYVHIPFCRRKCKYCHFFSVPYKEELEDPFLSAVLREFFEEKKEIKFDTLYLGGGTPSLLSEKSWERFSSFVEEGMVELTVEVNPEDRLNFRLLRQIGFNRISIAAISFNESLLDLVGRRHGKEDIYRTFSEAEKAGFENLNLDLIYGIPGQLSEDFIKDLKEALGLRPVHVSLYMLELHANTLLGKEDPFVREEDVVLAYERARKILAKEGYEQYEISNFAKPGYRSHHNLKYWKCLPYIGLGPSAVSFLGRKRWKNLASLRQYISALSRGDRPIREEEHLSQEELFREKVIMGLRLREGVRLAEEEVPENLRESFRFKVEELLAEGLLEKDHGRIKIPDEKVLVTNEILLRLLW